MTKNMRDVASKATTRTNSEMGLNHGISTSTLIGMQLQIKNINQTTDTLVLTPSHTEISGFIDLSPILENRLSFDG